MDRNTGNSLEQPEGAGEDRSVATAKPRDVIRDDEQYQMVQEQLGLLQSALAGLERTIRPKSEERFRLVAESYEDMIARLESQLRDYEASRGAA